MERKVCSVLGVLLRIDSTRLKLFAALFSQMLARLTRLLMAVAVAVAAAAAATTAVLPDIASARACYRWCRW